MSDEEEEEQTLGKLYLKVKNALLIRDVTTFTTMDPYVMIRYGTVKYKTNPCVDGGKTPHWEDEFELEPKDMSDEIHVFVMDTSSLGDDNNIGGCHIKLHQLCAEGKKKKKFSLLFDNKKAGDITFDATFEPKDGATPAAEEAKEEKPA